MLANKVPILVLDVSVCIFDLLLLYYFKYSIHSLHFENLNLEYTGNSFNLIFYSLLIILIIANILKKKAVTPNFLILFTAVMTLFLLSAVLSTEIKLPLPDTYLFVHPFRKVLIGALFSAYQYFQFVFIFTLLFKLFEVKRYILVKAFFISMILIIAIVCFTFLYVTLKRTYRFHFNGNKNIQYTAVVLGAAVWSHNTPSPNLRLRIDKAYELYKKGYVEKIQLTGSNAPGELSEAEVAYRYLKTKDVNLSDIWIENKTTSTDEQIQFIKNNLLDKYRATRIVIISDKYHLVRVKEICKFYNIKATVLPSDLNLNFLHRISYEFRESIGLILFWFFAI